MSTVDEKLKAAHRMVCDLCQGKQKWVMHVPAKPDSDPDLVIAAGISSAQDEIASLRKQLSESEAEIAEYKSESWCFNESHTKLTAEVATLKQENKRVHALAVQSHTEWLLYAPGGEQTLAREGKLAESYIRWINQSELVDQLRQALEAAKGALKETRWALKGLWSAIRQMERTSRAFNCCKEYGAIPIEKHEPGCVRVAVVAALAQIESLKAGEAQPGAGIGCESLTPSAEGEPK